MRRSFILGLLLTTSSLAFADRFEVSSAVATVDLYPDGAVVGRQTQITLPVGEHELVLTNLPQGWDTQTFGVQLFGAADLELRAYSIDMDAEDAGIALQIKALEEELERLRDQIASLREEDATLQAEFELVDAFLNDPGLFSERPDALEFWTHLTTSHARLIPQLQKTQGEIQVLNEMRDEKAEALSDLKSEALEAQATLYLSVASAGEVGVAASYFTNQGGWAPSYIVELEASDAEARGEVRITQQAELWQQTGEDWEGASAALHSTFANTTLLAPTGRPFEVSPYGKRDFLGLSSISVYKDDLPNDMILAEAGNALPVQMQSQVREFQAGYASTYGLAAPLTLASDSGEGQTQVLEVATAPADLWIQSVAARDPRGMLMAGFDAPLTASALPGHAKFFRDGSFVGRSTLAAMQPGEALELAFGIDTLSTITRNETHDQEGGSGFIGRKETLDRSVETLVSSGHAFTMPFKLIEAQPISRHEDIEVTILRGSDGFDEVDLNGLEGVNAWTFTLEPGEETRRTLSYRIEWPEDMSVEGL